VLKVLVVVHVLKAFHSSPDRPFTLHTNSCGEDWLVITKTLAGEKISRICPALDDGGCHWLRFH
jgi:hypothetical protein